MASPDRDAERVARRINGRADEIDRRYLGLVAVLYTALRRSRSTDDSREAIDRFIQDVSILVAIGVTDTRTWADDLMGAIYGQRLITRPDVLLALRTDPTTAPLFNAGLFDEQGNIARQLREAIARGTEKATQQAAVSGRTVTAELAVLAFSKQEAYNLRRSLDSAVVNSAAHAIWLTGIGVFDRKIVVAVLDKDTTALCRRLDGTVWAWDEFIVDEVSGGRRMFPPFVGSDFEPAYHPCRSVALPYFG